MTASDILNMDVETIWPLVRRGVGWWLSELAEMTPKGLRPAGARAPSLCAEAAGEQRYLFSRDGRPAAPPAKSPAPAVTLLLPGSEVLVRGLDLPVASERDARRLLALDIDRLTPFSADQVFTAVRVGPLEDGRRRAVLAVTRRNSALERLQSARDAGLDPRAVGVAPGPSGENPEDVRLDFMPSIRAALGSQDRSTRLRWLWIAVGGLVLANMAVAIGTDITDLAHRRAALERAQPAFNRALRIRKQVQAEQDSRIADVQARDRDEPLRVLAALTEAIPDGAWVQRLAWNGQAVRVSGYENDGVDIGAALGRSPMFRHVRNSLTDTPAKATAGRSFDVTADVAPAAHTAEAP